MSELTKHTTSNRILEHLNPLLSLLLQVLDPDFGDVRLQALSNQVLLRYRFETLGVHLHQTARSQSILRQAPISVECQ